ncbi:chemotaxis protein CheD [Geopsychrobacter electrodiphilus]|uniref:chemotaxis protein CheD n=1 Tax=Geopsychrobacter electrodiphilus TaxID=225196 RepID=UPI000361911C|nr:chemotaxis protein CheD [Geopsychrobacter electrodiphilus]
MSQIIIGVGEYGVSNRPGDEIKTFALGSCVAVIFLDPRTGTLGMLHVALPESEINKTKSLDKPGYFADTGIPALLAEMARLGCSPQGQGMVVKLCGGANIMDTNEIFQIGKCNALSIKKLLWIYEMDVVAEDLGGTFSRSVSVSVETGEIILSSPGRPDWKL